tara:strand:- start:34 stop:1518 length:1485 start_codon:yes stop_codon:yes gene_type:complete
MAENTGLRSLIIDPTQVDPQIDVTGLRTATDTSPQLLAQAPDFQGVQFDPTSYDYISDLYELYSGGLPMLDTPTTTDTAQIPGAVDTLVNVGNQSQATGVITDPVTDPTLDTTFQDAGAVDTPGTIGTLGNLTTPTTIDQVDYTDAPTTVPALDLSGTSTDLINQGVIETPQEFYARTYNTSPSEYEFLDNEEQLLVDQQYANAYGLAPVPEPATTLTDIVGLSPTVQVGKAIVGALTPDESVSEQLTMDPDTGLFEGGDPGVDAAENEFANIQDTPSTVITTDPINTALTLGEGQTLDDIGEIDTPQVQTPAEQIFDQGETESGSGFQDTVNEADVEAGLAQESISNITADPSDSDEGTSDEQASAAAAPDPNLGTSDYQGDSGGSSSGGSSCVIATHAVNSGAFTPQTKREAVRWCVRNLHRTWWGEAVRRGYKYYGQKAIDEGKAKNHYQEFKDYVAFGTGKKRTLKTAWTFVYRTIQFFIKGVFIKNAKR